MKRFLCTWIAAMAVCGAASVCTAETVYVTDVFEITLRTGPSIENKIIKMVSSGKALALLETREGWSRVRIPGATGPGVALVSCRCMRGVQQCVPNGGFARLPR